MAKKDEIKAGDIHALLTAGSYEAFPTLQRWLAEGVIDKEALNRPLSGDADGRYPIHVASRWHSKEMISWLVENGVDINVGDNFKETALFYGSAYLAPFLISLGADPSAVNENEATMFHAFIRRGNAVVTSVAMLKQYPDIAKKKDYAGRSPLVPAFLNGETKICPEMVKIGLPADELWTEYSDPNGILTTMTMVEASTKIGMFRFLLNNGFPFDKISDDVARQVTKHFIEKREWDRVAFLQKQIPHCRLDGKDLELAWHNARTNYGTAEGLLTLLNAKYKPEWDDAEMAKFCQFMPEKDMVRTLTHKFFKNRKTSICDKIWENLPNYLYPQQHKIGYWTSSDKKPLTRTIKAGYVPRETLGILAKEFVLRTSDKTVTLEQGWRIIRDTPEFEPYMNDIIGQALLKFMDVRAETTSDEKCHAEANSDFWSPQENWVFDFLKMNALSCGSLDESGRKRLIHRYPGRVALIADEGNEMEHLTDLGKQIFQQFLKKGPTSGDFEDFNCYASRFSEPNIECLIAEKSLMAAIEHNQENIPDAEIGDATHPSHPMHFEWTSENVFADMMLRWLETKGLSLPEGEVFSRVSHRCPGEVSAKLQSQRLLNKKGISNPVKTRRGI